MRWFESLFFPISTLAMLFPMDDSNAEISTVNSNVTLTKLTSNSTTVIESVGGGTRERFSTSSSTSSTTISAMSSVGVGEARGGGGAGGVLGRGVIDDLPQRKILLTKGVNGLGFNIRGGIDAPYVKSDKGCH